MIYWQEGAMGPPPPANDRTDDVSLDTRENRNSVSRIMNRFADKTSLLGVLYISNSKLKVAKMIWIVLLMSSIGVLIYHLYFLCAQFFEWPKTTKISLGFDNLNMPAVTICNANTVKNSHLQNMSKPYQNFVNKLKPKPPAPGRRKRYVTDFEEGNFTEFDENAPEDQQKNKPPKNTISSVETTAKNLFMDHGRKERIAAGHRLRDMVISCSFDGRDCYYKNFTLYPTAEFGNCYTLQSDDFVVQSSGPYHGLNMILYMESSQYLKGLTQGFGARVTIHSSDTYPFPEVDGFFVSSGFETSISMKVVNISRIGSPWGNCEVGDTFKSKYKKTYSRQACHTVCENEVIINKCDCFDKEYAEVYRIATKDYRPCKTKNERECLEEQRNLIKERNFQCDCLDPCREKIYEKTISTRQWPTEEYASLLSESICKNADKSEDCRWLLAMDNRQTSLNFLKLVIYFESLNYENVKEEEEITVAQFLSDFGGALGLWIGLSVISLFELVQLAIELCYFGCSCSGNTKKLKGYPRRNSSGLYEDANSQVYHSSNRHIYSDPALDVRYLRKENGGHYEIYTGNQNNPYVR